MKKILCATDFSKTATRAMDYAAFLAIHSGAQLTLLHTIHLPLADTSDAAMAAPDTINELSRGATEKLNATCRYLTEKYAGESLKCNFMVKTAILADAIRNMVESEGYDFVVAGSTGGGNTLEEIMMGSNTLAVIEHVKCPVLTIPTKAHEPQLKKITYASDLQDADNRAIERVLSLARITGAEIEVVHIDKKEDTAHREKALAFGKRIQASFSGEPIRFTEINHPDEEEGLKGYLTQSNSDMLVILKKHRSFFSKFFSSSLTETLTYESKYPMLILHEDNL